MKDTGERSLTFGVPAALEAAARDFSEALGRCDESVSSRFIPLEKIAYSIPF